MVDQEGRAELLALVADKYFIENMRQIDIAEMIGVTRSSISRMLTEAREKGVVEIIVHHPLQFDHGLERKLESTLKLKHASVVILNNDPSYDEVRKLLGKAASRLLVSLIKPGQKIGVTWGTTVQATIEALDPIPITNTKVIQLVGILGPTRNSYSAQTLVEQMAQKIEGEGRYLYVPFIVENELTATSLLKDSSVKQAISLGRDCDIAMMGVGTTIPEYTSLFKEKHITIDELKSIQSSGAVGCACGLYFGIDGKLAPINFHQRRIGIDYPDLLEITTRLGIAGNINKAEAIVGAIRGGFINSLVTDHITATRILELTQGTDFQD